MPVKATNTQSEQIGRANRRLALATILFHQPISRTEIAARTGLTGASVSRITRDLIELGLIPETESSARTSGLGRRFVSLDINPTGGIVSDFL